MSKHAAFQFIDWKSENANFIQKQSTVEKKIGSVAKQLSIQLLREVTV
jgi:hypothetical protein